MTIQQFVLILRARWWVILATLATVVAVTVLVSTLLPKKYSANATILLDIKLDPVTGSLLPVQMMPTYMTTQVDVITSNRVARRVVKSLKLDQVPQFREQWEEATDGRGSFEAWLGDILSEQLEVKPSRESNVISIAFTWPDAKAAAALANAFAQAYIDTTLELKVEPAKQYATWFEARNRAVRDGIEKAQKRLSDFQREQGIVASDERVDMENARLGELSSQLVGIQAMRSDSQSRQNQATSGRDLMPEVLNNPLVAGLSSDIARMEVKRDEMTGRFGSNHPEIRRVETELSTLKDKRAQEIARVTGSLGASNRVNVQRESEVRIALEAQKQKVLQLKQQRDQMAVLQNEVALAQRNYEMVTQRLAQSNLESQTQQTNIALLTPAEEPLDASSPKRLRNALLATFLGTLLGIGAAFLLELLDQRVRSADGLRELLNAPVLGSIAGAVEGSGKGRLRKMRWRREPVLALG